VPDPEESARLISLARLYRRQGNLDRSAEVYQDVLTAEPDNQTARRELEELCGEGVAEITDEDVISPEAHLDQAAQRATAEPLENARRRKIAFLQSWLEHIRAQD
jgi:hypothetical protein